jgi:hypothetical protein
MSSLLGHWPKVFPASVTNPSEREHFNGKTILVPPLLTVGRWGRLWGSWFVFLQESEESVIAEFPESVQEEDGRERQQNEAHEHAVNGGD